VSITHTVSSQSKITLDKDSLEQAVLETVRRAGILLPKDVKIYISSSGAEIIYTTKSEPVTL
jgi:DNA-binding winged helix-turn-helix (wHTH) protein